jgi:NDP-sugar pyrophosphorylase family protein
MQAVVLAAGLGTRLKPVTANRSKAMVPVLGRPLAERALMPFVENGIREVVFVISADDTEIKRHFTENTSLDIDARFVIQKERLGTAHALGLAAPLLSGKFVVSACDSLVNRSHVRQLLDAAHRADVVLSLLDVGPELVSRSAAVELDGDRIRRIVEKPILAEAPSHTVSLSHYVFGPPLIDLVPQVEASARGEYEIQDAIQMLIDVGGRVVGVRAEERRQVSTPEDLLGLTRHLLLTGSEPGNQQPAGVGRGTRFAEPLYIGDGVVIGDGCEVGPEVYLESGCRIGHGAVIRRSIVLRGARVGDGRTIEDRVVV